MPVLPVPSRDLSAVSPLLHTGPFPPVPGRTPSAHSSTCASLRLHTRPTARAPGPGIGPTAHTPGGRALRWASLAPQPPPGLCRRPRRVSACLGRHGGAEGARTGLGYLRDGEKPPTVPHSPRPRPGFGTKWRPLPPMLPQAAGAGPGATAANQSASSSSPPTPRCSPPIAARRSRDGHVHHPLPAENSAPLLPSALPISAGARAPPAVFSQSDRAAAPRHVAATAPPPDPSANRSAALARRPPVTATPAL